MEKIYEDRGGQIYEIAKPALVQATKAAVVPVSVSRFKALAILELDGQLASVELLIATQPKIMRLGWDNAQVFYRNSPAIEKIAKVRKWTKEYVDSLFIRAALLPDL